MQELIKQHAFFDTIFQYNIDTIVVLNKDGIIIYRSDDMQPSLGWQSNELIGTDIRQYIHEEDIRVFEAALHTACTLRTTETCTYRAKACSGQWRWITSELINMLEHPAVQGFILRSKDITDNIEAAAKIKEKEAYYESLFCNHPDSVTLLNSAGQIEDANASTIRIFGYAKEEIINQHFASFVKPEALETSQAAFAQAWLGKSSWIRGTAIHKNGTEVELSITLVPIMHQGKVIKVQAVTQDITQVIRAHQLIEEQAEAQSSFFESVNEGFLALDKSYYVTYVNQVCASFLGLRKEELLNKFLFQVYPSLTSSLFFQKCKEVEQTGKSVHFQEYFPLTKVTLYFDIYPTKKGVAVHFLDVTEKIAKQAAIEKLYFVASKVTNGVLILDADLTIEWANESFLRVLNISLTAAKGKRVSEILGNNNINQATVLSIGQKLKQAAAFSEEIAFTQANGTKIWLQVDVTPALDEAGNIKQSFLIITDITELKEAEIYLQQQADALFLKNQDLQQFTYMVSHNLRAPVANALGYTDLLYRVPKNDPVYDEILNKLKTSVTRLDDVIKDMNTILAVKDKDKPDTKQPVSVAGVFRQVHERLQGALAACGGHLVTEVNEYYKLNTDKVYLYSIIYKLVSNAIKYRSPNRPLRIKLSALPDAEGKTVLRISDNGIGMDMQKVKSHLFKLYKRFNTNVEGKGIGLLLVKNQVEALGGRIEVASQLDSGTVFTITFNS
ncbi:MAG: PAS domain-containing sensor histidine kinase [Adhaeribacter sp.]